MYIVFPIRFNRLQCCNGYLASLPRWRPRFDSHRRTYFRLQSYFSHFLYIWQQEFSSVLHKILRTSQKFSLATLSDTCKNILRRYFAAMCKKCVLVTKWIKSCLLPCFGTFKMPLLMFISILVFRPEGQI